MIELLSIPGWNTPPRSLEDWSSALTALGHETILERESATVCWLEVGALRLRGYALVEEGHVTAINWELHAPDAVPAEQALQAAASVLGWEVHDEDDEG